MTELYEKLRKAYIDYKGCNLTFDDVHILWYYLGKLEKEIYELKNKNLEGRK